MMMMRTTQGARRCRLGASWFTLILDIRLAVSGGATATREYSADCDALPCWVTPYTHKHKDNAAHSRMGALPCNDPCT